MRAKKSLGQNFLQDRTVVDRIVDALDLRDDDVVIEIGPGMGALTEKLIDAASQVIALEFDRDMIQVLSERFGSTANFQIISADALDADFASIIRPLAANAKLVANLPYNISSPILQRLIEQRVMFSRMVLMFQREVVERITAKRGGKERGYLSVLVESAFGTEYLFDVSPQAFRPIPKVWSAVVRLVPKPSSISNEILFREIVSVAFAQKRKHILNNLKVKFADAPLILDESKIDGRRRAETLTLEEWKTLTNIIAKKK